MTFDEFKSSLTDTAPPAKISDFLKALWYDGKGDWEHAHELAQAANTVDHCLIHAYLHRKEGDPGNAGYWYNRAHQSIPTLSLEQEWKKLVQYFLKRDFPA
jgi:hypothetical protein